MDVFDRVGRLTIRQGIVMGITALSLHLAPTFCARDVSRFAFTTDCVALHFALRVRSILLVAIFQLPSYDLKLNGHICQSLAFAVSVVFETSSSITAQ